MKKSEPKIQRKIGFKIGFKLPPKLVSFLVKYKKYLLILVVVLLAFGIWQLSQTWALRSYFTQAVTFPKASVLGINVGDLNSDQLTSKINNLKTEFESKKITMVNSKDQWVFGFGQLGISFDVQPTIQAVLNLNKMNIVDKYRLMVGNISSVVTPAITINNDICVKALSALNILPIDAKNALVYFDQTVKIKSDEPGSKFNPALTCKDLSGKLETNLMVIDAHLDAVPADISKTDLDSKLSVVNSMVGESLLLKNGTYQKNLTPDQLFAMVDVSKDAAGITVNWSSAKIDDLVNGVADEINTYISPAVGGCQTLVSSGGNWLDKTAAKNIITELGSGKPRSYDLPVSYHAPIVSDIKPVAASSNVVYLTFDDGLIYGDRIMNYAACYGIKVTFFELGARVNTDAAGLRRAIAEGHSVQSHGYEHAMYDYGNRSYDWQNNDIKTSIDAITGVTGIRPTYFRPPGGNRSNTTYDAARANNINLILWSITSSDSGNVGTAAICSNVLNRIFVGANVLMHSSRLDTTNALPCIIEGLAARGYSMQALR